MNKLTPLLITLLTTLLGFDVAALCMSGSSEVYPEKSIPNEGRVVVFAYGVKQKALVKAVESNATYFVSGNHKVKATFGELLKSQYRQSLVTISPAQPLKVGKTYRVTILGETHRWRVAEIDDEKPKWKGDPSVSGFQNKMFGCGPSTQFKVEAIASDASPIYFDVELQTPKDSQRFYVLARGSEIPIGHGMCSGGFVVSESGANIATITPVDAGGNRGPSKRLELKASVFEKVK